MPVKVSYPGVYLEELTSSVHTITGVSTSVAAVIGNFGKGPINEPVQIFNMGDFERSFGGITKDSEGAYALQQFFLNGGSQAWVVRAASDAKAASVRLGLYTNDQLVAATAPAGGSYITFDAISQGIWGNNINMVCSYSGNGSNFNLFISEFDPSNPGSAKSETHYNLSLDPNSPSFIVNVINNDSSIVQINVDNSSFPATNPESYAIVTNGTLIDLADLNMSTLTGTDAVFKVSGVDDSGAPTHQGSFNITADSASSIPFNVLCSSGFLKGKLVKAGLEPVNFVNTPAGIQINGALTLAAAGAAAAKPAGKSGTAKTEGGSVLSTKTSGSGNTAKTFLQGELIDMNMASFVGPVKLTATQKGVSQTIEITEAEMDSLKSQVLFQIGGLFEASIRRIIGFGATTVTASDSFIQISDAASGSLFINIDGPDSLKTVVNAQYYSFREPAKLDDIAPNLKPSANNTGAVSNWTLGSDGKAPEAIDIIGDQLERTGLYALEHVDIFNILLIPRTGIFDQDSAFAVISQAQAYCESRRAFYIVDIPLGVGSVVEMQNWMNASATLREKNSAVFFPNVKIPNPIDNERPRLVGNSGTLAGVFARTDTNRGVWKAPAGVEATLRGVMDLEYKMTDAEDGTLNPVGVNALRSFPIYGNVSWGSRTLVGADQEASQWKYIPVRRTALYIEESLMRGLKWVVFEPNDEDTWSQIRLNVGAFLRDMFKDGAFGGTSPSDSYFVLCDSNTTTQNDIDQGIVNIVVGFAPLKPAEFVILKLQQIAGKIQT